MPKKYADNCQRLTATVVAGLAHNDKPYEIRDATQPGLVVRVQPAPSTVKTFYVRYTMRNGRPGKTRLGRVQDVKPEEARNLAKEVMGKVAQGQDPQQEIRKQRQEAAAHTLKSFVDKEFEPWVVRHHRKGHLTAKRIKNCFYKQFENKRLNEITVRHIEQWRNKELDGGKSRSTINRDVAILRSALSRAVHLEFLSEHPLKKLKQLSSNTTPIVRFLSKEEEKRLQKALKLKRKEKYLKPMVVVSLNTGLRQGELFNLEWSNVDFERKLITVVAETAKSGKVRHVNLNKLAFNELKAWRRVTSKNKTESNYVFPGKNGGRLDNVKRSWATLLSDAQINDFRWHDQRHHFASKLVMAGVDLNTVRELLGHADIKMTLRYAHLAPEHKAEAVARIERI